MKVQHKAFLDLETSLTRSVTGGWSKAWKPLRAEIRTALLNKDWHKADKLIDTLNTDGLILQHAPMVQTIGVSSLLLGASRLHEDLHKTSVARDVPARQLGNGVTQWGFQVSRNTVRLVRRKLHVAIALLEHNVEQARHVVQKEALPEFDEEVDDLLDDAGDSGEDFVSLASSLLVSRMSSFGFMMEAQSQGLRQYQISEVLDEDTCGVCEVMDGQVFTVAAGMAQASAIMDAEDPDSLAAIAPWPSQSADSVADLEDSSTADLVDAGLALPPYHPGCRGVTVGVDESEGVDTAQDARSAAGSIDVPDLSMGALAAVLGLNIGHDMAKRFWQGSSKPQVEVVTDEEDEEQEQADEEDQADQDSADETQKRKKKPNQDMPLLDYLTNAT